MEVATVAPAPSLSSNPELDLVTRHRYGEAAAFEEIYTRFVPMVYQLCLRMARSPEKAEDLAQEVFLRIYRHLGRFDGRSTLKTWIYRVTLNHCRSRLGRRKWLWRPLAEETAGEDDVAGVQLVDERRGPESRALASDDARTVHQALQHVKPVFREAVVLRDLEGLAYDEIAEILQVRIGTVRSRIARGRDQLRRHLVGESS